MHVGNEDQWLYMAIACEREHENVSLCASVVHVSKHGSLVMHTMASFHKLDLGDF